LAASANVLYGGTTSFPEREGIATERRRLCGVAFPLPCERDVWWWMQSMRIHLWCELPCFPGKNSVNSENRLLKPASRSNFRKIEIVQLVATNFHPPRVGRKAGA
jgi:hypothetical protein